MTPERFANLQRALERRQPDLTAFLDGANRAQNLTSIIRTADAVGIQRLHAATAGGAMRLQHMIAGGAKHWVAVTLHASTRAGLAALRDDGWRLVAAHGGAGTRDYRDVDYTAKVAIVFGAEAVGLSDAARAAADDHIAISMHGIGRSLNLSVAVGVILAEAERQRLAAGLYDKSRLSPDERERTLFEWSYPELAERFRQQGRPYPALTADGKLASNPLIDISTVSQ
ncbi:MAG: tRNA (guanine-N2)-dimethyltransferase [Gammaproteobacteria bacterium]|nr:tRNA (guanine-N2)-dimethyltransferase [Gammaproteobacteria bacterium]